MTNKSLLQILLLVFSILIIVFSYKMYFEPIRSEKTKLENEQLSYENINSEELNILKEINYNSSDKYGNKFIIQSKSGTFKNDNKDLIIMNDVNATIMTNKNQIINLTSEKALYNSTNNDTNFYKNVLIEYANNNIACDNVDIIFADNLIQAYNNLFYTNNKLTLLADKAKINFLTNESRIFMFDKSKVKVKVIN